MPDTRHTEGDIDTDMQEIKEKCFKEERALFGAKELTLTGCNFEEGESPLKESADIYAKWCNFSYKYPLWYSKNISLEQGNFFDMARAGVWYSDNIKVSGYIIAGPKNFRRCKGLSIEDTQFSDARETLWNCDEVTLSNVSARGDYFAMNSSNIEVRNLTLDGNYSFDGCRNVVVRDSKLLSKDAFWNCENVTVFDSYICGEYIAWNSKNVKFIGCTIESLQGLCYVEELTLERCHLPHTTLAFEKSKNLMVDIDGRIGSIFNPGECNIICDEIEELIIEKDKVDESVIKIICNNIGTKSDVIDWTGRY